MGKGYCRAGGEEQPVQGAARQVVQGAGEPAERAGYWWSGLPADAVQIDGVNVATPESNRAAAVARAAAGAERVWVQVRDGRIGAVARGEVEVPVAVAPVLLPGLVDLQINGFAGFDPNSPDVTPETLLGMARALWTTGVTSFCPTITTQSFDHMVRSVRAVARACAADVRVNRSILGVHLEGPYVSGEDGPRGAHPAEWVRDPDWDEFQRLQEAAEGRIRIVTLAPERAGAVQFIRKLVNSGVLVSIGHTAAGSEQIRAAIDAGATLSTHLGNGAHGHIRRHPNYIWDQLAADELVAGIIVDGHHLPAAVVKVIWRAKGPERLYLVSDAVAIAGLPPGRYVALGQQVELTASGRVNLLGTEYLAGSALELRQAVLNFMRFTGVGLAQAWALASTRPLALLMGQDEDVTGEALFHLGARADLVLADANELRQGRIKVLAVVLGGEVVYQAHAPGPER